MAPPFYLNFTLTLDLTFNIESVCAQINCETNAFPVQLKVYFYEMLNNVLESLDESEISCRKMFTIFVVAQVVCS